MVCGYLNIYRMCMNYAYFINSINVFRKIKLLRKLHAQCIPVINTKLYDY